MVSFSIPRKVIVDCDPGIDDAVALCMALFEQRLDVTAITAVAGNVSADQATLNVQAVVDLVAAELAQARQVIEDPKRPPHCGQHQVIRVDFEVGDRIDLSRLIGDGSDFAATREAAVQRARGFTWRRAAEITLETYQRLV